MPWADAYTDCLHRCSESPCCLEAPDSLAKTQVSMSDSAAAVSVVYADATSSLALDISGIGRSQSVACRKSPSTNLALCWLGRRGSIKQSPKSAVVSLDTSGCISKYCTLFRPTGKHNGDEAVCIIVIAYTRHLSARQGSLRLLSSSHLLNTHPAPSST